jgi:DNA-binding CsgD family transcriptional regulator
MEWVVRRLSDKEMAGLAGGAVNTIHAHRTSAYARLGAHGRDDAVRRYLALYRPPPQV